MTASDPKRTLEIMNCSCYGVYLYKIGVIIISKLKSYNLHRFIAAVIFMFLPSCAYQFAECSKFIGNDAIKYDECLAAQGNQKIQYKLGLAAYEQNNMGIAIQWLEKAAMPNAPIEYFKNPMVGNEVSGPLLFRDQNEAYPGYRDAQLLLIKIYSEGLSVEKDLKKANYYHELAALPRKKL